MGKLKKYRQILRGVTEEHAQTPSPMDWIQSTAACDFAQNNYFLIDFDSSDKKHYIVFHLRLAEDGKVLIMQDGIEYGVAQDLMDAGILPADIILPFKKESRKNEKEQFAA
mgnify:CR=1 FL=1